MIFKTENLGLIKKVIASTHSDYIAREINTLIMLTTPNKKSAELKKKYGYHENQLLKPTQIEALLFRKDHQIPTKITITETGFEIATIDQVIAKLNQSSQDVYFNLFD
jgi:hypothetical protein